ncbi:MAG: hypothetical protein Q9162_007628 [Coniocarpon cinnabarinum]
MNYSIDEQNKQYMNSEHHLCHQALQTCNYEGFKNRNPERVKGTGYWVLQHHRYRAWRESSHSDLLWISADPGCGKSVLAKSFVDDKDFAMPTQASICYFFFKDNEEQDSLTTALCALLHQLFSHKPHLLLYAIGEWKKDGSKLCLEVDKLWRILSNAAADSEAGQVICVLDALDECAERDRSKLIDLLLQMHHSTSNAALKFIVTSRPYIDLERKLNKIPEIRLRGEDENTQLRREIDLVIRQRVQELAQQTFMERSVQLQLEKKLLNMEHRTYLWLYLAFDDFRSSYKYNLRFDRASISALPSSVQGAYERILAKIPAEQIEQARQVLRIVVGVRRPFSITELAYALGIATAEEKSSLGTAKLRSDIRNWIRQCCGLFVFFRDSKVYLIHQTAKEFLLNSNRNRNRDGTWNGIFNDSDINYEVGRICILCLCSKESEAYVLAKYDAFYEGGLAWDEKQSLLTYSAEYWTSHLRNAYTQLSCSMQSQIDYLHDVDGSRFKVWFPATWRSRFPDEKLPSMTMIRLCSFTGHIDLLRRILNSTRHDLESIDAQGRNALFWSSFLGYESIVQLLLYEGADVNARGGEYGTALQAASGKGYDKIVQMLLDKGADVNAQGPGNSSALRAASGRGYDKIVQMLLDKGADINAQGGSDGNALQRASDEGHQEVVQMLLDKGADVNAQGGRYGNALQAASGRGHDQIVQTLLERGADVNAQSGPNGTALQVASGGGYNKIVQMLLDKGANSTLKIGEATSDNGSYLSDISSVFSGLSISSTATPASAMEAELFSKAAEYLASLFLDNTELRSDYKILLQRLGVDKFAQNHDRLLKEYFKNVRCANPNENQLAAIRFLRVRPRRQKITDVISKALDITQQDNHLELSLVKDDHRGRKEVLEKFLEGSSNISSDQCASQPNNPEGRASDTKPESDAVDSSSEGSSQQAETAFPQIDHLADFFTGSIAFKQFEMSVKYIVQLPVDLQDAVQSNSVDVLQDFLVRAPISSLGSENQWLYEMIENGYSWHQVAELLLQERNDSPWIYHSPHKHTQMNPRDGHHVPHCAHQTVSDETSPPSLGPNDIPVEEPSFVSEVREDVEELCGIGGVAPLFRDSRQWNGVVTFEDDANVSVVTYLPTATSPLLRPLAQRLYAVVSRLCTAAATVQSKGLCCDSFTFLVHEKDSLKLRRIQFLKVTKLASSLQFLCASKSVEAVSGCAIAASDILQELPLPILRIPTPCDLHYSALAAQFLCVAFSSYIQAHIGPLEPFFLDTAQQQIKLLGCSQDQTSPEITASLVELTCLREMTRQRILAFRTTDTLVERERHDVSGIAEDFLDTWGPGYLVRDKIEPKNVRAIAFGGGYVSSTGNDLSHFHWTRGAFSENVLAIAFGHQTPLLIGFPAAAVRVNARCCIDDTSRRKELFSCLENIGTHEYFWEPTTRQAGIQSGKYVTATANQTWTKNKGMTLKDINLQREGNKHLLRLLDKKWGLQVSLCTSVARRVTIQELVADLLPAFVNPIDHEIWEALRDEYGLRNAFQSNDLVKWICNLPEKPKNIREFMLTVVRDILEQLQHTGLEPNKTDFAIAWPKEGEVGRGLKMPCKHTTWAHVIADATDCATFAYITTKCLETGEVTCRGDDRSWQSASALLETEVSPFKLEKSCSNLGDAANNDSPESLNQLDRLVDGWSLEHDRPYYIRKMNSTLMVKAKRSVSTSNSICHLIVTPDPLEQYPMKLRERIMKKGKKHIRERQAIGDPAEFVLVGKTSIKA